MGCGTKESKVVLGFFVYVWTTPGGVQRLLLFSARVHSCSKTNLGCWDETQFDHYRPSALPVVT